MADRLKDRLAQVDHWPLMERMLGQQVRRGQMLSSPFREGDRHPSFGLYRNEQGQARWKDFAFKAGDVYDMAMLLYGLDYPQAKKVVAELAGHLPTTTRTQRVSKLLLAAVREEERAVCTFVERIPTEKDFAWWSAYGIELEWARGYGLCCAGYFTSRKGERAYHLGHSAEDPLYVYRIGTEGRLKAYRPLAPKGAPRYIGNTTKEDVFGHAVAQDPDPFFLCAGQKDLLAFVAATGASAWALNSESTLPSPTVAMQLFSRRGIILYDNDQTGYRYAQRLSAEYPMLTPFSIAPWGRKDLADIAYHDGPHELQKIHQHALQCLKN